MKYLLTHSIDIAAAITPDKLAFICGSKSITYKELKEKTNQVANILIQKGAKKGDRIGVYLNRCLETSIAIYGIMKAGCAYVPLDPNAPNKRVLFQLSDCGITQLITNPNHLKQIKSLVESAASINHVIGVNDGDINSISWEGVFSHDNSHPEINVIEKDLAYIMYTSGTTGVPKGIMHTHRSGLAYAKLSADLYQLNSDDVIGNHAPLYFDISTLGYFTSPLVGATTVIAPEAYTKMATSLAQLIAKTKISVWYSVPLALIQMLQQGGFESNDFSSLRWVLFGGEVFHPKHLKSIMNLLPNCTFSNVYGPTEVNQCTYYNLTLAPTSDAPLPLGKIWENTEALILDSDETEVAKGEAGELAVRSATMMIGYWNQTELTRRSFHVQKNDFGFEKIYYKTGDIVRENELGNLEFIGRKDRQVKVRGYRIELDELTNTLLNLKEIEEAAVFAIKNMEETEIYASVILKKKVSVDQLHESMSSVLPKYALPKNIVIKKEFPRSPTGKIDLKKLVEEAQKEN